MLDMFLTCFVAVFRVIEDQSIRLAGSLQDCGSDNDLNVFYPGFLQDGLRGVFSDFIERIVQFVLGHLNQRHIFE